MKRFMLTVALTCTLSISAFAGEMPTTGVTSSTPPPAVAPSTAPGEMPNGPPSEPPADEPGIWDMLIMAIIAWR